MLAYSRCVGLPLLPEAFRGMSGCRLGYVAAAPPGTIDRGERSTGSVNPPNETASLSPRFPRLTKATALWPRRSELEWTT